jgi:hypothetical protein
VEYKQANGDCNVPHRYSDNPQLAVWVSEQRQNPRQSVEREAKLNSVGFVWKGGKEMTYATKWDWRFQQLVEYKQANGDCNVPHRYSDNPQLGMWVYNQSSNAGLKRNPGLSVEREAKLNSVGFVWHWSKVRADETNWDWRFQQLVEYKEFNGDCNVPLSCSVNPQLAVWVERQRRNPGLSLEREAKLNSIGFV